MFDRRRILTALHPDHDETRLLLAELNIGHYLIGEAIFVGLESAVRRMRNLMDDAR